MGAGQEAMDGEAERSEASADEALQCAREACDAWEIANATRNHAVVAATVSELRVRVERASSAVPVGRMFDDRHC